VSQQVNEPAPAVAPLAGGPYIETIRYPPGYMEGMHGEAGYRASVAASFLDAVGRTVVAVDDEYDRAARAGLPVDGNLAHAAAT